MAHSVLRDRRAHRRARVRGRSPAGLPPGSRRSGGDLPRRRRHPCRTALHVARAHSVPTDRDPAVRRASVSSQWASVSSAGGSGSTSGCKDTSSSRPPTARCSSRRWRSPRSFLTPLVGRLTGRAFRKAPHRAVQLSALLLLGFNLALVGWWTHSVAATAVLGALGFACVVGAIAAILPVAQAVIPPQTRAQGFGAFINSLFVGAFVAGAPMVDFWPEVERQHTALSIVGAVPHRARRRAHALRIALRGARHAPHGRGTRGGTRARRRAARRHRGTAAPGAQPRLQLRTGAGPVRREHRPAAAARRSPSSARTARGSPPCYG